MISRTHRFHGYNSLRHVYRSGQIVRGPLFALRYLPNPRRQDYRLAVVVSRKVVKTAVGRNRIRRRLFEAVREVEDQMGEPYDIIINVFHETVREVPAKELSHMLKRQLHQAGITKPKA